MVDRVMKLLRSNVELESLEIAESVGFGPDQQDLKQVLLRVNIVSSMRSKTQVVIALFQANKDSSGNFVAAKFEPPSFYRCSCETGKALCSHLTAFLVIIKQIQGKHRDLLFEDIQAKFPCMVKLISNKFVPLQLVYDPRRYKF